MTRHGPPRRPNIVNWGHADILAPMKAWSVDEGQPPHAYEWSPTLGRAVGLFGPQGVR
jgi:hypothetical protein